MGGIKICLTTLVKDINNFSNGIKKRDDFKRFAMFVYFGFHHLLSAR